jgi:hypothetical protein
LNFSKGKALELSVDILQQMEKQKAIHEALVKRREDGRIARGRLDSALKDVRLTGGALFKVSKCVLDREVLELRTARDNEAIDKARGVLGRAVNAYNKRMEKYVALVVAKKDTPVISFGNTDLALWLKVRKRKKDGAMPTVSDKLKLKYQQLKDKQPLTLKEYLLDEGKDEGLVDALLTVGPESDGAENYDHPGII